MTSRPEEFSPDLTKFIHSCIDSVEQLQILLLLAEQPSVEWSVEKLSQELRSSQSSVQKRLHDLKTWKVLSTSAFSETGAVRYLPSSPEVEARVRELVEAYRQRPHRVIAQIYSRPPAALQSFADSFKFKKEPL